ncbi:tyrosine-protein phosphatase [Agromyces cerinus]|uniref:Protein-tyrosine phosphatase n=1 Tax=Agromyces cerinus subsp. cerinus TaxID=232089 RepID=A0A1N6DWY8_9MICO|nr:tyrosine-protein phosphatase [Agromyces cerinus]SIN75237.1 protein-tyrosine phosphatase [Agromyces cerinus subsp. cerinus]
MTIDGFYNFRDTGGMPLTAGGTTRSGVLFRSDALSGLTDTGLAELAATDIGVIVDFRTPDERQAAPDRIPTSRPFTVVELALLEGAMADMAQQFFADGAAPSAEALADAAASVPTLGGLYVGMLQHGAAQFAEVARRIAASTDDSPSAVLVHCTAGKDRTGVATALMLDAAGAERTAIVADYAASEENLAGPWADGMLQMIASFGLPLTPELRNLVTGTPPDAIEQALAWVDTEYGGSAAYLASGGLTTDELAGLRARIAD